MTELEKVASPSFHQLLLSLQTADEAMETVDLDAQLDLLEAGKIKVDNYKYILDKLELQAEYLHLKEQEYAAAKTSVKKNIERLKKHLLFALQSNDFEKFTGHQYVVRQAKSAPSLELKASEPTLNHAIKYPNFVRTSYDWDKKALINALKAGDSSAELIADIKHTVYIKFTVNKEVQA